jgi:hypothetical protein
VQKGNENKSTSGALSDDAFEGKGGIVLLDDDVQSDMNITSSVDD